MGEVIVINKYKPEQLKPGFVRVNVMRPSSLGNPFVRGKNAVDRNDAVAQHEQWFRDEMRKKETIYAEIMKLVRRVVNGEKLALECCCHPLPCHAHIYKAAIEGYVKRELGG